MNLRGLVIASMGLALFFAGCSETSKTASDEVVITAQNISSISEQAWELESMTSGGQEYELAGKMPTVKIAATGKVTGFASLNMFFGSMEIDDSGNVKWPKQFGATRMAGAENLMKQENTFLSTLPKTEKISLENGKLNLVSNDGQSKLVFGVSAPKK